MCPPLEEGESWDEAAGAGAGGRAGRRGAGGGALQLGRDLTQTRPGQTRGCMYLYYIPTVHCTPSISTVQCSL